jgi:hypothetical protein
MPSRLVQLAAGSHGAELSMDCASLAPTSWWLRTNANSVVASAASKRITMRLVFIRTYSGGVASDLSHLNTAYGAPAD